MRKIGIGIVGGGYMGKAHSVAMSSVGAIFNTELRPTLEMIAASSPESADRYRQAEKLRSGGKEQQKFVPEGVEGLVAYRGKLAEFTYQLVGGLRSAMGYCGCGNLNDFREHARFVRVSGATVVENHPHDIRITKESPNYMAEDER